MEEQQYGTGYADVNLVAATASPGEDCPAIKHTVSPDCPGGGVYQDYFVDSCERENFADRFKICLQAELQTTKMKTWNNGS